MKHKLVKAIATVFGIGLIPYAQGTLASLAGIGVYMLIHKWPNLAYIAVLAVLTIVGFWASGRAEHIFAKKDSRKIVIDEVCGMLVVLLFIPYNVCYIIGGFILYRIFDIIKIYPLNKLERLPAGWGIMLDDFAAGLYANIILQVATRMFIC